MGEEPGEHAPRIIEIRGQRVVLDADLARLYGVRTRRFNEAVKRNRARFPQEFAFQLTSAELASLSSRNAAWPSQVADSEANNRNRSQIATGSQKHRDPRYRPWAFTEHGVLMAANVLRSSRAIQMSVFVIRAFVRLREQVAANRAILQRLAEIDATLLQHDSALRDIYRKLLPLLQPLPDPPKRRIGFHPE
jgi:ORF6N domain